MDHFGLHTQPTTTLNEAKQAIQGANPVIEKCVWAILRGESAEMEKEKWAFAKGKGDRGITIWSV